MATHETRAMMPGLFYRKPSPDEPAFRNEGDTVSKGDVIGLIEVMKTFHEVQAECAGTLVAFRVEDGAPIAPGAVIAEIRT